jgi:phosphoglycolate phosphatase
MQNDSLIFDLDGTLWDARPTVAKARNNVIDRLELKMEKFTPEDITKTMGLPMEKVYEMAFPLYKSRFPEIRPLLDQEINSVLLNEGAPFYSGVKEGLEALSKTKPLFIVSNCSVRYLESFLEWSGFRSLFSDYACNGTSGVSKAENIKLIVERNGLQNPVYIGDTKGDHDAANSAGTDYIHVDYGFGEPSSECIRISHFLALTSMFS